ncbi:MAG TPA: phage tail tape measure protein [Clostridia bacterium]|nr:phage tail tape measure protein [Clostridia bacterium]
MASRKEYEMLFKLSAQLGGSYSSTFKAAQSAIASMQKEIDALNKTQSDVAAYQKQQASIEATKKKLELLQQQYDNIQRELKETGDASSDLQNKLLSKQMQIDKTTASINAQTSKLGQMKSALNEAGVSTDNLEKESAELASQIDGLKQKQQEAADKAENFGASASQAFGAVQEAIVAAGIAKALQEIYEYFLSCAEASREFETAITGVAKTTDLTDNELQAISESIKELSTDIPITTTELAGIGEVAGQLGIAKDDLLDFSTVMSMLATATTMTAEESATMLAQFANITQMDPQYYDELASAIVDLGNNYATTEQKITDMSQGIAASASLAGMSEADMLGLSAAVSSLGIESQMGSTSVSKLISMLMTAVETGEDLDAFARVAGMSAQDFSQAWGQNAAGALESFVVGLSDTERLGASAIVTLTDLGITETRMQRTILSLSNSGNLLTRTIATANEAWAENNALQSEAEKRYATTQSLLTMKQSAYNNLKIAIGDSYNPVLKKLYELETSIMKNVTQFVEQNPGIIRAITAFIAVVGSVTAGLAAYTVVAKLAAAANVLLTSTIPGVNIIMGVTLAVAALAAGIIALSDASKVQLDESWELTAASREQYKELQSLNEEYNRATEAYGETSYEAQQLRWRIEGLNKEYESGKQTIEDYKAAHEKLISSYDNMSASHTEASDKIQTEQQSVFALIGKLSELASTTDAATKNKQAILAIIDSLNESVPELAISYDQVANASGGFIDSLYDIAKAQSDQLSLGEKWSEYIDRVGQQGALKSAKEAAEYNAKIAQEEYETARKAYADAMALYQYDEMGSAYWTGEESATADAAKNQLDEYNKSLEETTTKYQENEAAIAVLEGAFQEYQATQDAVAAGNGDIKDVIKGVTDQIKDLTAAYKEAYDAAFDSIQGQYDLWDKAASVVATSAGTINSNLQSQISYWQQYNENLDNLNNRSADIQGLGDMIASFADGSSDSVNAIAGMANASDSDLQKMVENWQRLQEEQKTAAGSLADLETDFTNSMDALQQELAGTIAEMNLSDDAAESAKRTMQGFVDGAINMLPAVQEAYKRVAESAVAAIDEKLEIHSPSRVMENRAEMTWAGYIGKTEALEPDVAAAMANTSIAGVEAFSAQEAQIVAFAPQLMAYLSAMGNGNNAVSAESNGGGGVYIALDYAPQYNLNGVSNAAEVEQILRDHDNNLRDYILEVMESAGIDAARRAYK